jgi:transposase
MCFCCSPKSTFFGLGARRRARGDAERTPQAARIRRQTVEHPFGTIKAWMGATHFLTKTIPRVSTEMSLLVLAYNMKRAMQILGITPLMKAMRA